MMKQNFKIENIPAILWGDKSENLFVVVHGDMSNKADDQIVVFAEEAMEREATKSLVSTCLSMVIVKRKAALVKFKTVFKILKRLWVMQKHYQII